MTLYQIIPQTSAALEELVVQLRENPSQRTLAKSMIAEKRKCLEPVVNYLSSLGVDKKQYTVFNALGYVNATLTETQVEILRQQTIYVKTVTKVPEDVDVEPAPYHLEK